jgi:hypothetical protein
VQKPTYIRPALFKAILVVVFGAFFFVQAQSAFMYCAYDSDFPSPAFLHSHIKKDAGIQSNNAPGNGHYSKLNKRYQVVTAQAILPAPVVMPVYCAVVYSNWLTPPVLTHSLFLYSKPLRGPPFI